MPEICRFYGIVILMYHAEGSHQKPHFHARYGEHAASVDLDGSIMEGSLPTPQAKQVRQWPALHLDELARNWELARGEQPLERIAPTS